MGAKTGLIVEDDLFSAKVAATNSSGRLRSIHSRTRRSGIENRERKKPDLALLDLGSTTEAGGDGFKVLGWLQRIYHDAPIPIHHRLRARHRATTCEGVDGWRSGLSAKAGEKRSIAGGGAGGAREIRKQSSVSLDGCGGQDEPTASGEVDARGKIV